MTATLVIDCPLAEGQHLYAFKAVAVCQGTDGHVVSPFSPPMHYVWTVPEPALALALMAGAGLVAILRAWRNRE